MSTEHLLGDIGSVLEALMGTADDPRKAAEKHLQQLAVAQPAEVLLVLAQIGAQAVGGFQLDHRLLSLILLKRLAFRPLQGLYLGPQSELTSAPFDVIREVTRGRIEKVLCAGLKDEMDVRMRKGLGTCTASWAQECAFRHRPFLPLPPVLLDLTTSPHPFHRFTPFQLLDMTPSLLENSVTDPFPASELAQILLAGLNDPSVDVRVEAMRAVRSVLLEGVTGKEREEIGAQLVLQAIQTLAHLPAEKPLSHGLDTIVDIASVHPSLFMPSLTPLFNTLLPILSPPSQGTNLPSHAFSPYPPTSLNLEEWEEVANPALEIIITLSELRGTQIENWEGGRAVRELVGLLIGRQVASFGENCDDWLEAEDLDDEDEDYPILSEESLDRLAMALGGESILPELSKQVQALLTQADWRCRYAAITAIASVAEGAIDELAPRLRDVLTMLSPTVKDEHPRVRYSFLQCLGQMSADLEGAIQSNFADDVLQVCLGLLEDPVNRVRTHAAAVLTNFCQEAELHQFERYLGPIVQGLLNIFQTGPVYTQDQVFATISTVAIASEAAFLPYYRDVMDLSLHVLTSTNGDDKKLRKLQGRAMECASMTGMAVGAKEFGMDAVKLAEILMVIQNQVTEPDDSRANSLMETWSSMCRSLGGAFEPFLAHVVPPVLKAAAYKPPRPVGVGAVPSLSSGDGNIYDPLGTNAHTAEIDEKIAAFENLSVYAFQMRGKFAPWLMPAMELTLEELAFPYSESVREAAAFLVSGLLQVAKDSNAWSDSPQNLVHVFQKVITAMNGTDDFAFLALLYKSFIDSLRVVDTPLPLQLSTQLLRATSSQLTTIANIRADRELQEPYMDDGDREIYLEEQLEENACLTHMKKAMETVLKTGRAGGGIEKEVEDGVKEILQVIAGVKARGMKEIAGEPEC
ncbi:hypothetical protein IAT38_003971 [Cryptococcus sp. DSM 104549]